MGRVPEQCTDNQKIKNEVKKDIPTKEINGHQGTNTRAIDKQIHTLMKRRDILQGGKYAREVMAAYEI